MSAPWIEVDASRLATNVQTLRRHVGSEVIVAPVVKSNAYGHGLDRAARAFVSGGADWLCVHALAEALAVEDLRLGVPVLVLGPLDDAEMVKAVDAGLHMTIASRERLQSLARVVAERDRVGRVHLKVETGTHRQGMEVEELDACLDLIEANDGLEFVGLHSHFANIEDTTRHEFAASQVARFEAAFAVCAARGLRPRLRHMASSAATLLFPHTHFDLVRPGIAAYGLWPSSETRVSAREHGCADLDLAPALTWKCRLSEIKVVPAGSFIGYGCTDKVEVDTRLGVVPVGYADGYRRALGGRAHVLVRQSRCRVRGRVCMNLVLVDLSHLAEARVGDEVVLLGRQGDEEIRAEQMADWAHTIHYEVLAALSPALERREAATV